MKEYTVYTERDWKKKPGLIINKWPTLYHHFEILVPTAWDKRDYDPSPFHAYITPHLDVLFRLVDRRRGNWTFRCNEITAHYTRGRRDRIEVDVSGVEDYYKTSREWYAR